MACTGPLAHAVTQRKVTDSSITAIGDGQFSYS